MATPHAAEPDRVRANSWHEVNERLDSQAAARVLSAARDDMDLDGPIAALGREWDFERVLQAEAAATGLVGLLLALRVHPNFLFVPAFAAAMLFLHAVQGWYPLLPILRRLGVRSQDEIDRERYALKALRGDFAGVSGESGAARAAAAWRAACA
jgi:hypothetical protein